MQSQMFSGCLDVFRQLEMFVVHWQLIKHSVMLGYQLCCFILVFRLLLLFYLGSLKINSCNKKR